MKPDDNQFITASMDKKDKISVFSVRIVEEE